MIIQSGRILLLTIATMLLCFRAWACDYVDPWGGGAALQGYREWCDCVDGTFGWKDGNPSCSQGIRPPIDPRPGQAQALYQQGAAAMSLKDYDAALKFFTEANTLWPDPAYKRNAELAQAGQWEQSGFERWNKGDLSGAKEAFEVSLGYEEDPWLRARWHALKGHLFLKQKAEISATAEFMLALQLDPEYKNARLMIDEIEFSSPLSKAKAAWNRQDWYAAMQLYELAAKTGARHNISSERIESARNNSRKAAMKWRRSEAEKAINAKDWATAGAHLSELQQMNADDDYAKKRLEWMHRTEAYEKDQALKTEGAPGVVANTVDTLVNAVTRMFKGGDPGHRSSTVETDFNQSAWRQANAIIQNDGTCFETSGCRTSAPPIDIPKIGSLSYDPPAEENARQRDIRNDIVKLEQRRGDLDKSMRKERDMVKKAGLAQQISKLDGEINYGKHAYEQEKKKKRNNALTQPPSS